MTARKIFERLGDAGDDLDRVFGNLEGKLANGLMHFRLNGRVAQALKAIDQRIGEAVNAITMLDDAVALHLVQLGPHLNRRVLLMVEKGDEAGNRPLEVNVVFPERVIGVDEKGLGFRVHHLHSGSIHKMITSLGARMRWSVLL